MPNIQRPKGFEGLASHKWPLERYAERRAAEVTRYVNDELDLAFTEKEILRIEVKYAILRAIRYGQKHQSAK